MKVNMRSFLAIICILFVLTINSCSECSHKVEKIYRIYDYMDRFNYHFKENSIWIYQNTTTFAHDTVTVLNSSVSDLHELVDKFECTKILENGTYMRLYTSHYDTTFPYVINNLGIGTNLHIGSYYAYYDYIYSSKLKSVGESHGMLYFKAYYEQLSVMGITYSQVKEIRSGSSDQFGYNIFFWCPHYGVIKKEKEIDNVVVDSWELTYSNVKQ
jgi:hypothetical protein